MCALTSTCEGGYSQTGEAVRNPECSGRHALYKPVVQVTRQALGGGHWGYTPEPGT